MISIVCVYNNEKIFNEFLHKSLQEQSVEFELIRMDNIMGDYHSAAQALNSGGLRAKGKFIMFAHQDVDLSSNTWLENVEKFLESISYLGIAGVAGMSEKRYKTYEQRMRNIIRHGNTQWGNEIQKPERVQALDECLIIIPKSVFNLLRFDEKVCDDWHLYATDYCLSVRKLGLYAYVIPMSIYHRSTGDTSSQAYYKTLDRVLKKHKGEVAWIYKSCMAWSTSYPLLLQRIIFTVKQLLIKLLIIVGVRYLWRKTKKMCKRNSYDRSPMS